MENRFYVYAHIRLDTDTVFHIGKGTARRAWQTCNRNKYWKRIVATTSYRVEIIANYLTEDDAYKKEIEYIKFYKNLNQCESNFTIGGIGKKGCVTSEETKHKLSLAFSGEKNPNYGKKFSKKTKNRMSLASKGKSKSPEHRAKITETLKKCKGKKARHHRSVIDCETKIVYPTIREAAKAINMNHNTLYDHLVVKYVNRTSLMFLSEYEKLNGKV